MFVKTIKIKKKTKKKNYIKKQKQKKKNKKQNWTTAQRESDLFNHEYDYKPNWTTQGSVTN